MKRLAARAISGLSKLARTIGFHSDPLPLQPAFETFRILDGVYVGGLTMLKNTGWEMHPDGDEALTLLFGRIDVVLQNPDGDSIIPLEPGRSCVVPKGVWHRQIVHERSRLLFHTYGDATRHKPQD
ncbi:MAG: hypothetical protein Q8R02_19030 [Hyphomonadaceae bacterium]|nr:hypothetical protein [Hyphomonadaceae bacterium]